MMCFLVRLGITRDSGLWWWGKVVSLAGMVTTGLLRPADFGLSDAQAHWVSVGCGVIAYISGQMSTSGLPGKQP
jgi:hypothetical protein